MIDISIIIPCYNSENTIVECLDSCLNQTFDKSRYEIICCNDGSTDNTLSILKEYESKYNNIKVIDKIHTGVADTRNAAILSSAGKYILLTDADDINYPNRLEVQYNILENNKNIDILSGGFDRFPKGKQYNTPTYKVTFDLMLKNNFVANPVIMFRRDIIYKVPFLFEQYYAPCEDYKFWFTCIHYGLNVWNYNNVLVKYRIHENQISNNDLSKISVERIQNLYNNSLFEENRELTVILTFNNEGCEVEKTVQSIFATTKHTKIILVDDASQDNYNYINICNKYKNVTYIRNNIRKGVAESRNIGVAHSKTEYCLILDSHMRFYDNDWDIKILNLLKKYNNSILCSNTIVINKDKDGYYINEDNSNKLIRSYGATVNLDYTQERCFRHKWNYKKIEPNEDNLSEIPSVLGACYSFTKTHWNKINGLTGLIRYGLDEALMSIKTWMFGGKCYLINDLFVGHLYRDATPYIVNTSDVAFNEYFCIKLFVNENEQKFYIDNLYKRLNDASKKELGKLINKYNDIIIRERNYIDNNKTHSFEWFKTFNDSIQKVKKPV